MLVVVLAGATSTLSGEDKAKTCNTIGLLDYLQLISWVNRK